MTKQTLNAADFLKLLPEAPEVAPATPETGEGAGGFSRRAILRGAGLAAGAAALATGGAQTANAQIGTFTPVDWSRADETKNIPAFNQEIRFDYYPDVMWTTQYPDDPGVTPSPQAPAFTLNRVQNATVSQVQKFEPSTLFKGEQKRVVDIENSPYGLSKTVVQPPVVGFGQSAPKELEYVIRNAPGAQAFNPQDPNAPARPGSVANGILVIPEEAVKKDNIGFTMAREGNDMILTLTTFDPNNPRGSEPVQVTRYVMKDQLDDTKHPPITKVYIAGRNRLTEPVQFNALKTKIPGESVPSSGEAPGRQSMNQYTLTGRDRNIGGKKQYVNPFFYLEDLVARSLGLPEGVSRHVNLIDPQTNKPELIKAGLDVPPESVGQLLYREIEPFSLDHLKAAGRNFRDHSGTTYGVYNPDRRQEIAANRSSGAVRA